MENLINRINNELFIVQKMVETVRSNSSDIFKINTIINFALSSEGCKSGSISDWHKEWIKEQITENDLPEDSSGSFITALLDEDVYFAHFETEEHIESEYLTKYIQKKLLIIKLKK